MRFYTGQHKFYCGIDLHARSLYVCVVSAQGEILVHRKIPAHPEPFLKLIAPYREDVVVAVECMFAWYWIADVCAGETIPFVLGHALYMKAIHGAKAKNDRIDSKKIAILLKGGNIPQAYVYPPEMRSTRDLLRRRNYLRRKRAELLSHIEITNAQYNLPLFDKKLTYRSNRQGVAERFADPSVRLSIEMDIDLIDVYDQLLREIELYLTRTAKVHDPQAYHLLRTIPGCGEILSLVLLYEIHVIQRFPRVQDLASYSRLVKCSHESAGKRTGTGGAKIGNAHLKWAFSELATLFLRGNPKAQAWLAKQERKHGKGKGLTILAHKLARSVYFMLKRGEAFDVNQFFAK
jgi:transposase